MWMEKKPRALATWCVAALAPTCRTWFPFTTEGQRPCSTTGQRISLTRPLECGASSQSLASTPTARGPRTTSLPQTGGSETRRGLRPSRGALCFGHWDTTQRESPAWDLPEVRAPIATTPPSKSRCGPRTHSAVALFQPLHARACGAPPPPPPPPHARARTHTHTHTHTQIHAHPRAHAQPCL
jgi:hypothetical protein